MDLHDYRDVAENYDLYLDVMYRERDNYEGFKDFYLDLARTYGQQGVIDIACGTGAVLLHLAKAGIDIDGTDLSGPMCEVARRKAAQQGLDLTIFPANMTDLHAPRRYSLAIIARSGFMHLLTPADQRAALMSIRECLTDGGILTLNTFAPFPPIQAAQMRTGPEDYTFRLEYVNADGQRERLYDAITYDPATQVMHGSWKFETLDDAGHVVAERIRPLAMRQTYAQELRYLLELCGFEVLHRYGDYYRSEEDTGRYVWVLRKR